MRSRRCIGHDNGSVPLLRVSALTNSTVTRYLLTSSTTLLGKCAAVCPRAIWSWRPCTLRFISTSTWYTAVMVLAFWLSKSRTCRRTPILADARLGYVGFAQKKKKRRIWPFLLLNNTKSVWVCAYPVENGWRPSARAVETSSKRRRRHNYGILAFSLATDGTRRVITFVIVIDTIELFDSSELFGKIWN